MKFYFKKPITIELFQNMDMLKFQNTLKNPIFTG